MPIIFTVTSSIGFPGTSIPGDAPSEELVGSFPSVYGGAPISFDVKFEFREGDETSGYTYFPILAVQSIKNLEPNGISIQATSTNTVTISGTISNIFLGEYFRFLMRDRSQQDLPPINSADWVTLIKWQKPLSVKEDLEYQFQAIVETAPMTTTSSTASILQSVFWNFEQSLNQFNTLIDQGEF